MENYVKLTRTPPQKKMCAIVGVILISVCLVDDSNLDVLRRVLLSEWFFSCRQFSGIVLSDRPLLALAKAMSLGQSTSTSGRGLPNHHDDSVL